METRLYFWEGVGNHIKCEDVFQRHMLNLSKTFSQKCTEKKRATYQAIGG